MNILLFTLEYPPFKGGVANYYGHMVKYWPSYASLNKATDGKPKPDDILVLDNNHNVLLKNWLWPKWLPAIWHLWQTVKKQKIEHILVGHILPIGTVTYYVTKLTKTPYSVFLHGMDFTFALRVTRKKQMARRILIKAKHIICANSYTAGLVKEFVGKDYESRVVVVNPGVDPLTTHNSQLTTQTNNSNNLDKQKVTSFKLRVTRLKEKYNLADKIVLFSIGRLVKRKGFDKVIEAMPEVTRTVPNLYYFLAGDGPDKIYIKGKAKGVRNIIFLDRITEADKWAWLDLCDIFIMPARNIKGDFEGFGIVYLEANLAGKPVIAGNSGGVGDAVQNMISGLLVNPENTAEISKAIIKLATDANLRKKLGEQGRQRALMEFRWEDKVKLIYRIITN
jgi:phosphatidylinositol alpha-1,6-mannosyltransferase